MLFGFEKRPTSFSFGVPYWVTLWPLLFSNWPHLRGCLQSRQSADNGWVRLGGPIDAKVGIIMTKQGIVSLDDIV